MSYDDLADRTALASDARHKFLTYQLPTLEVWPTVALMGDGCVATCVEKYLRCEFLLSAAIAVSVVFPRIFSSSASGVSG